MTAQKRALEYFEGQYIDLCNHDLSDVGFEYKVNTRIAIECIEKQIPKKPIYSDYDNNGFDERVPYKATCPTCGYEFEFGTWNDEENHHCVCGQKVDWRKE